eukprot:10490664-Karenia_brevis.AAC.1
MELMEQFSNTMSKQMEEIELSRSKAVQRMHQTIKKIHGSMGGSEDRLLKIVDETRSSVSRVGSPRTTRFNSRSNFGGVWWQ